MFRSILNWVEGASYNSSIGNARRALGAAEDYLRYHHGCNPVAANMELIVAIGYNEKCASSFSARPLVAMYHMYGRDDPDFGNVNYSRVAHQLARNYCSVGIGNQSYLQNAIACVYFSILATPCGTQGREEVWNDFLDLLNVGETLKMIEGISKL